jgi:hypothetical protein
MAEKYDFIEFAFSRDVVTDYPKVIEGLDKMQELLLPYSHYRAVHHVVLSIEEARLAMLVQLDHYAQVYKRKGLIKK